MLEFLPGSAWLAIGGAIAAAGPVLIHLLNRRRFKVVHWAAMDFLLHAVKRNRKVLELRDLILLAIRTLCVLLVGLALAGSYFACDSKGLSPNDPLHAILVVDNGLSMGYETGGRTLLDEAKRKAHELVERLPSRSRVSVIPLCGSGNDFTTDPYPTKDDAYSAIEKVELVDRFGRAEAMVGLAKEAATKATDLPVKRVVFLTDNQAQKWSKGSLAESFTDKDLADAQIVAIRPPEGAKPENSWIEDFSVVNDFANAESPAKFLVKIRHEGPTPRSRVEVTLTLTLPSGETITQNQTVDLEANTIEKEVLFVQSIPVESRDGQPVYISAKAALSDDHLHADNVRYLSVPVMASVPVVFVDSYGKNEEVRRNRIGETYPLRKWLSPVTRRGDHTPQYINERHLTIGELSKEMLSDARLVVIAGVSSPEAAAVPLLRDYVQHGGQVVIAAGAEFDAAAWNQNAWLDGAGILPAPILSVVGKTPDEDPKNIQYFNLNTQTMSEGWFGLPTASREDQAIAYKEPYFFKAISLDVRPNTLNDLVAAERKRLSDISSQEQGLRDRVQNFEEKQKRNEKLSLAEEKELAVARQTLADLSQSWLAFRDAFSAKSDATVEQLAEATRPNVLASFTNDVPFLVERRVGTGRILFLSTGLQSSWNDLKRTNAMVMFDHILPRMLKVSVPLRTHFTDDRDLVVPVSAVDRLGQFGLWRPGDTSPQTLPIESLGPQGYGVIVRQVTQRGIYRIAKLTEGSSDTPAKEGSPAKEGDSAKPSWEISLAVNGPSDASELAKLSTSDLKDRLGDAKVRCVDANETVTLEGSYVWGQHLWWTLILIVVLLLLVEMLVLAWPRLAGGVAQ